MTAPDTDSAAKLRARNTEAQRRRRQAARAEREEAQAKLLARHEDELRSTQQRVTRSNDEVINAASARMDAVLDAYGDGLSVATIAEVMGVAVSGVYPLLNKARRGADGDRDGLTEN